ncbi:MAG: substrate-binding domain-containing protein [Tepidimonas sp.]|nr:substrate-binding domain-containing protein [Tepidimonas sp.]
MRALTRRRWLTAALLAPLAPAGGQAQPARPLVWATTTSVEQSGLMAYLLPVLQRETGLRVRVVALGSGQALDLGRRGDADVLLVHDPPAELRFMAEGWGQQRRLIMRNDLVLLGPAHDPAGVRGLRDAAQALARIAAHDAVLVSRGDRSGTHEAERRLWQQAGWDPERVPQRRACGCGMGAALTLAAGLGGYVLADRATWLAWPRHGELALLVEGDARLANPYHLIVVHPQRHPHVRAEEARRLADWLVGPRAQRLIGSFRLRGQVAFEPAAALSD